MPDNRGRLGEDSYAQLDRRLQPTDAELARRYPGEPSSRQPVHTVYVPADRFRAATVREWGQLAVQALDGYPDLVAELAGDAAQRVRAKLVREPIEDLRIDFEDGLGSHPDEDTLARTAAAALTEVLAGDVAPPFSGIRFKSLEAATRRRGVRTLDCFLGALGDWPEGFVVTLPKVSAVEQVSAMVSVCEQLEAAHGLSRPMAFELQIETPPSILGADGLATVARMIEAGAGRCHGLHYGTYDYSAALGIAPAYQSMEHPGADHAKAVMQVAAAGTGVRLSDGSSNVLPVGSAEQVATAWRLHARLVRRSLERGFYQGWDLHPHQLVSRYAATYRFFREGLDPAAARLSAYLARVETGVLDEPATARALAGFLRRGLDCAALDEGEVRARTGLGRAALEGLG